MLKSIKLLLRCSTQNMLLDLNQTADNNLSAATCITTDGTAQSLRVTLTNSSSQVITLTRAFIRLNLEAGPYEYYYQSSRWSMENYGYWQKLNDQGVLLTHKEGRTTGGNTPYIALRQIGFPQTLSCHIVPLGNWRIRVMEQFFSNTEPEITVDLGMRDEELNIVLAPGESWTMPEVIIQQSSDFESAMCELHRFLKKHYIKQQAAELPVIYNTWFDRFAKLDLTHLRETLTAAREIGCETFIIDAGWYGGGSEGWSAVGDWREKTDCAFYGKMRDFADEVRNAGLNFGIWMEPERYVPAAPVTQQHPEWFIATGLENYLRIDLEQQAARDYFKSEIVRLINTYDLCYIKFDMNATLGSDSTGYELNSYQRYFLGIIDEVKREFPQVILENCSSGAMRCDLATLKTFDMSFPSDNANAYTMLRTMQGLWRRFLPGRILRWCVMRELPLYVGQFGDENSVITPAEATFEEYERADLESLLIANFTGGAFGFSGDIASLSSENRALVKKYTDLYKARRNFLVNAEAYWLTDTERLQQFELTLDGNSMIITSYIASDQVASRRVYPKGLDADAFYKVKDKKFSGKELMLQGITIDLVCYQQYKWRSTMLILDKE